MSFLALLFSLLKYILTYVMEYFSGGRSVYKKGDGSQVGGSWWNKAQTDLDVDWENMPDTVTWNSTLSEFRAKNPSGKR